MNIQERAAKVLQEIDAAIALVEKATPGPWKAFQRNAEIGTNYCRVTFDCGPYGQESDSLHGYCGESNADFIADSRTLLPASLRCLKTAIKWLLLVTAIDTCPDGHPWPVALEANKTLTTICDQWQKENH